jgi:glycosyltransferase involved in cell wall biosynthesis
MCPSPSTAKVLTEHHFPEDKIRIWHRGVDTVLFSPAKRRKELRRLWLGGMEEAIVLLYVGRVSWEKNFKVLLEAYVDLHATRKDIHLVITGDGPARTELEAIFHDAKVPVTFTGYLQGTQNPVPH